MSTKPPATPKPAAQRATPAPAQRESRAEELLREIDALRSGGASGRPRSAREFTDAAAAKEQARKKRPGKP